MKNTNDDKLVHDLRGKLASIVLCVEILESRAKKESAEENKILLMIKQSVKEAVEILETSAAIK